MRGKAYLRLAFVRFITDGVEGLCQLGMEWASQCNGRPDLVFRLLDSVRKTKVSLGFHSRKEE